MRLIKEIPALQIWEGDIADRLLLGQLFSATTASEVISLALAWYLRGHHEEPRPRVVPWPRETLGGARKLSEVTA